MNMDERDFKRETGVSFEKFQRMTEEQRNAQLLKHSEKRTRPKTRGIRPFLWLPK